MELVIYLWLHFSRGEDPFAKENYVVLTNWDFGKRNQTPQVQSKYTIAVQSFRREINNYKVV